MRAECACNHLTKNSEVVLVEDLVYPRGNRGYWLLRVPSILLGRSILLHVQLFYLQKAYVSMAHSRAGCFALTLPLLGGSIKPLSICAKQNKYA